mmetsp:Transcript_11144/g.14427  ORF Transcript_11144/g.14427 Transcript_11144/m.14427 type:complete len:126 (+) Transcript_11144:289-666(+)
MATQKVTVDTMGFGFGLTNKPIRDYPSALKEFDILASKIRSVKSAKKLLVEIAKLYGVHTEMAEMLLTDASAFGLMKAGVGVPKNILDAMIEDIKYYCEDNKVSENVRNAFLESIANNQTNNQTI